MSREKPQLPSITGPMKTPRLPEVKHCSAPSRILLRSLCVKSMRH
jgi:hypothetical protein